MTEGGGNRKRMPVADDGAGGSKKKQKKGTRGSHPVALPYEPPGVVISRLAEDCSPQLTLSKDQLTVTGSKGFRMARATHGVSNGTWYWECTVLTPETEEGHCRLGWSLPSGSLQAPVGYDKYSYAYRDIAGSKVHQSLRTDHYGEEWFPGDVIGFLIRVKQEEPRNSDADASSDSGRMGVAEADAMISKSAASPSAAAAAAGISGSGPATTSERNTNEIRFFKNGKDQGVAFSGIPPGTYFPAVSLYMGGSVRCNFGPEFIYPPSFPRVKPMSSAKPLSKEEQKAQRIRIKQERLARSGASATRLRGIASGGNASSTNNSSGSGSNGGGSGLQGTTPPRPASSTGNTGPSRAEAGAGSSRPPSARGGADASELPGGDNRNIPPSVSGQSSGSGSGSGPGADGGGGGSGVEPGRKEGARKMRNDDADGARGSGGIPRRSGGAAEEASEGTGHGAGGRPGGEESRQKGPGSRWPGGRESVGENSQGGRGGSSRGQGDAQFS